MQQKGPASIQFPPQGHQRGCAASLVGVPLEPSSSSLPLAPVSPDRGLKRGLCCAQAPTVQGTTALGLADQAVQSLADMHVLAVKTWQGQVTGPLLVTPNPSEYVNKTIQHCGAMHKRGARQPTQGIFVFCDSVHVCSLTC